MKAVGDVGTSSVFIHVTLQVRESLAHSSHSRHVTARQVMTRRTPLHFAVMDQPHILYERCARNMTAITARYEDIDTVWSLTSPLVFHRACFWSGNGLKSDHSSFDLLLVPGKYYTTYSSYIQLCCKMRRILGPHISIASS